jgi:glycerol-3-phosphate dehydrogenase
VEHYVTREWALHLDDIMLRRAGWHYYHQSAPMIALRVADWMGELLAWTVEEHSEELDRYARAAGVPRPTDKDSTRRTGVPAN